MDERRNAAWIGGATLVKGDVLASEDLLIEGQVHGKIALGDFNLTVGPAASVVADIAAKTISISGHVKGDMVGSALVQLKASAKVEGDIKTPRFLMEEGATLSGKVDTGTKKP